MPDDERNGGIEQGLAQHPFDPDAEAELAVKKEEKARQEDAFVFQEALPLVSIGACASAPCGCAFDVQ